MTRGAFTNLVEAAQEILDAAEARHGKGFVEALEVYSCLRAMHRIVHGISEDTTDDGVEGAMQAYLFLNSQVFHAYCDALGFAVTPAHIQEMSDLIDILTRRIRNDH